ncbi:hypothetical protein N7470_008558 [Penicillium chermesinum]|nr:hypothetical protein N7470_008558 [Penicillium chermesinum]
MPWEKLSSLPIPGMSNINKLETSPISFPGACRMGHLGILMLMKLAVAVHRTSLITSTAMNIMALITTTTSMGIRQMS